MYSMHDKRRACAAWYKKYRKKQAVFEKSASGMVNSPLVKKWVAVVILRSDSRKFSRSTWIRRVVQVEIIDVISIVDEGVEIEVGDLEKKCRSI